MDIDAYNYIRSGGAGSIEMPRGLIAVWGKEAVPFLDGMITNDMKTLEDGQHMLAAFPNAQGRLLAVVRVLRQGERFLIETEEATREKVFQNLFRFTFAGDFFVEDLSDKFSFFRNIGYESKDETRVASTRNTEKDWFCFWNGGPLDDFVTIGEYAESYRQKALTMGNVEISADVYEVFRIESGIPKYGVDMDETTIVPELGLDGLISYNKGCYIGQEIIARIHFRGHVAKQLTGLVSEPGAVATGLLPGAELTTPDGKNAGRITSVTFSPKLHRDIALAYVRYDNLAKDTVLRSGGTNVVVKELPFV